MCTTANHKPRAGCHCWLVQQCELLIPYMVNLALAAVLLLALTTAALAQSSPSQRAEAALAPPAAAQPAATADAQPSLPLWELVMRGGWLMVPIALMSIVVVAIGLERALALRRSRLLPKPLAGAVRDMASRNAFDPRSAARLCQQFPSSAAHVVNAMLLKVGRPPSEIEHAITEACQREADNLYTNVRTLNLAAAIAPLLGLLGTVWGMIQAFFATANMPLGSNKAQVLAEGIYVALVTTFAGLAVAIPAAVLAHMFETRILRSLRDVEALVGTLLPQAQRHAGQPYPADGTRGSQLRLDQRHPAAGPPNAPPPTIHPETKAS